ncbi:MAG: hypothetical protein M3328_03545, partial [Chloroflexota bacterium]|nr:hypothetical protein [Chloroflexota bacterium]
GVGGVVAVAVGGTGVLVAVGGTGVLVAVEGGRVRVAAWARVEGVPACVVGAAVAAAAIWLPDCASTSTGANNRLPTMS